ncbi:polysaccharide deacetylase family protein [Rubrivirga sp. IMCC43871]|uniref:polysaccharide deacetylase family protein n=1 Tax=Rubrivirga sp. IMCC43871 TaxID=3391575 RepID=UPI00398FC8FA
MSTVPLLALLVVLVASGACAQAPTPKAETSEETPVARTIALTVDDLPVGRRHALAHDQRVTRDLLAQIAEAGVPATAFVNEGKLDVAGERAAREAMLQAWVDAGHDLGNHTYDHPSLFDTPLAAFQEEVRRGDVVTNRLLAARGDSVRYFRHPFLNVGPDLETKRAFEAWLADEGYTIAPVTHDNAEYIYALAYDRAADRGDVALQARIADAYLVYMDSTASYFEALGHELFGRELAHVLLVHANALNADHLGRLVAVFRRRGYTFVTLDDALADPVYASDDTYTGRAGMSWLQRWAITRGVPLTSEPHPDDWVEAIAYPND